MSRLGDALAAALAGGSLEPLGALMLQRVRMESGLDTLAGRPAVLRWFAGLAAVVPRADVLVDGVTNDLPHWNFATLRVRGTPAHLPGVAAVLPASPLADLPVQLWFRMEGALVVEIRAIVEWHRLFETAGIALEVAAAAIGAASPCHRPLGELASGQGQRSAGSAGGSLEDRWIADFNARRMPGNAASVLAQIPDAWLIAEVIGPVPTLCRLLGHANGRRVSMPAGISGTLKLDGLALAAVPHRPFYDL